MKDFIASEKFLIGSNGQVGGVAPNAVNDIIKWDGTKWVAGVNPGGSGGGGSAVAAPFTTSLNSGSTTYSVVFPEPFDITPRGGRREFPAVAVIVAEADKVTIYDGDDPDLNMWMVFEGQFVADLKTVNWYVGQIIQEG